MKLGPVTKLDNGNKSKKKMTMTEKCDVIVVFLINGYFGAIWRLDSGCIIGKTCIFINNNLLS